ncbi:MAG: M64 family metallopeptidase [Planctomycetota bacterium]
MQSLNKLTPLLIATAIFATVLGSSATSYGQSVWTTVKEWDTGDSGNRLDIVIMGDGYTAAEMPLFRTHVSNFIAAWLNQTPVVEYKQHVNIWRIEVESTDSGADHPSACFTTPVMVNTTLDASYCTGGTQRCLYCNTTTAHGTAALNVPMYDEVIVVVNDSVYGGCGGSVACYAGANSSSLGIAIHELGHSVFGLADEYDYGSSNPTYTGGQFSQVNVSNQDAAAMTAAQSKWHYWIGLEGVSAFEGAAYHPFGVWRPKSNCLMRNLGQPFCPVCREEVIEDLWDYVTGYDDVTPSTTGQNLYPYDQILSVSLPDVTHNAMQAEWLIDGVVQAAAGTTNTVGAVTTYSFDPSTVLAPNSGQHQITFRITDAVSWYLKVQPYRPLPNVEWMVTDVIVDFEVTSFSINTPADDAGELLTVDETISNSGSTASPVVRVGYYASTDANITTSDTLIEVRDLAPIPAGTSVSLTKSVRLPTTFLFATTQAYIGMIVDDLETLTETNDNNNRAVDTTPLPFNNASSLQSTTGLMPAAAATSATLSIDVGSEYGGSGFIMVPSVTPTTGPGSWLGPFVGFVDLALDDLSDQVVGGLLGAPIFQNFAGTLDAFGQGQAVFFKPALPPSVAGGFIHFAAAIIELDGGGNIVAPRVTNSTSILIF